MNRTGWLLIAGSAAAVVGWLLWEKRAAAQAGAAGAKAAPTGDPCATYDACARAIGVTMAPTLCAWLKTKECSGARGGTA